MHYLSSSRLTLRSLDTSEDRIKLVSLLANRDVTEFLLKGRPYTTEEADDFIDTNFGTVSEDYGLSVATVNATGAVIGFGGLLECTFRKSLEIEFGFALFPKYWGFGYGAELGQLQIDYGLETLGLQRLYALAHPQNIPSIKLLEKLGCHFCERISHEGRGPRNVYSIERR